MGECQQKQQLSSSLTLLFTILTSHYRFLAFTTTQHQFPRELVAREGASLYTEFSRLLNPATRELLGDVVQAVSRAEWGEVLLLTLNP